MSAPPPGMLEFLADSKQLRSRWFADLSLVMDAYMRSTAFLEWMRDTLTAMSELSTLQARSSLALTGWNVSAPSLSTAGDTKTPASHSAD